MKKCFFTILIFVSVFSTSFAARKISSARETAIDLEGIFDANQIGVGYNGGQISGALYSDFGTESLRFTVNILELGGSMFNNTDFETGTTMPRVQGLPKFFVGAGYIVSDAIRLGLGYGGKLSQEAYGKGWYANDASFFFQANIDDYNILKIGVPVRFGTGYGESSTKGVTWYAKDATEEYKYSTTFSFDNKNIFSLVIAPDIRFETDLGVLTEIRLAVPFGMSTLQSQTLAKDKFDSNAIASGVTDIYTKEFKTMTLGVDLEVFFTFITDPVVFAFVPHVNYKTALEGNYLDTDVFGGNVYSELGYKGISGYTIEKPWEANLDLAFEISTESEMVYVWTGPKLRLMAAGGKNIFIGNDPLDNSSRRSRKELFYGLGYALPIEVTIRPNSNLEINIGMIGEGTPFSGNPNELDVTVDGSVVWYF